jgi:lipopolysaccharide transport system ATP-binding protein
MSSEVAIRVDGLSKLYRIGKRERYKALRDTLTDVLSAPVRGARQALRLVASRPGESGSRDENGAATVWALRDVSFDVRRGDVVGVVGRNGAGKSTLLKILSRITEPTEGFVEIRGRVASLLEVGTGFHPELTGRENVYLNGAILGMTRVEIARKFDEIVGFAEVEKFIDTPVKYFSTGMQMRLAFSVAAHLEPEILIIDEVLAVGDARFQLRCLDKMDDVGKSGRTVLFVSHSMSAVTRLCQRAILLEDGRLVAQGDAHQVVGTYLRPDRGVRGTREWTDPSRIPGNNVVRLRAVRARTEEGDFLDSFDIRRPIGIEIEYDILDPNYVLVPNLHVFNETGVVVFVASDLDPAWRRRPRPVGRWTSTAWIPGNFLAEGTFEIGAAVSTMDPVIVHFYEPDAIAFQVVDFLDGDSARGDYAGSLPGIVRPLLRWTNWCEGTPVHSTSAASNGVVS